MADLPLNVGVVQVKDAAPLSKFRLDPVSSASETVGAEGGTFFWESTNPIIARIKHSNRRQQPKYL
jgi:hypothetical protein